RKAELSAEVAQKSEQAAEESALAARTARLEAESRREQAEKQTERAEKQTERTNSLILATKAQGLAERYPVRSMLLASQAILTGLEDEKGPKLNVEAENVLRRTLGTISGTGLDVFSGAGLSLVGRNINCVAYSPDGKTLAAGYAELGGSGGVVRWDLAGRT